MASSSCGPVSPRSTAHVAKGRLLSAQGLRRKLQRAEAALSPVPPRSFPPRQTPDRAFAAKTAAQTSQDPNNFPELQSPTFVVHELQWITFVGTPSRQSLGERRRRRARSVYIPAPEPGCWERTAVRLDRHPGDSGEEAVLVLRRRAARRARLEVFAGERAEGFERTQRRRRITVRLLFH